MNESARVVGYDYRLPIGRDTRPAPEWDEKRRKQFLLRPDVVIPPPSADGCVWREVMPDSDVYDLPIDHLFPADLGVLRTCIAQLERSGVLIALTEHCREGQFATGCPDRLPDGARLLGYDVVDPGAISCLTNFSYIETPQEMDRIRSTFLPHLNELHLFVTEATSLKYAEYMESDREPGHGPYCSIGVWVIQEFVFGEEL